MVKMEFCPLKLRLALWTMTSLVCVCPHEVTVKESDLKQCDDDRRVCVTDLRDCGPRHTASTQETLNVSCQYHLSLKSVTCGWSFHPDRHVDPSVSLLFSRFPLTTRPPSVASSHSCAHTSKDRRNVTSSSSSLFLSLFFLLRELVIYSCLALFNPLALLNVTARVRDYALGREVWSRPWTLFLHDVVKPPPPVLRLLRSTEDSVVVSWRSGDGVCQLRYRVEGAPTWTEAPESVAAHGGEAVTFTIRDLLVSTAYTAAVACTGESGIRSDWSSEVSGRTLDKAPRWPPEVCYRVEQRRFARSVLLHLMWKDLNLRDAGGRVFGYRVSYEPAKQQRPQHGRIQNVTELTALLVVDEGNCSVTVAAFNSAGYGPAARLAIDPRRRSGLPPVRHLWVSSSFPTVKGLLVQWENPSVPPSVPPVTHLAVQWRSGTPPSNISRWAAVDPRNTSAVIGDADPGESYLISVVPVYHQQCGPPQSLAASLQQGALMEAVQLKVVGVTKTSVSVVWAWQTKSGPIRVQRYTVRLREESQSHTLSPDQWQLTFFNLSPNTEYSLLLLADDSSRNIIHVRTAFDERPAVAAATSLLLLAVLVSIVFILARTLYKSYFFPHTCSPRGSNTGRWLMDPNHQKTAERRFLNLEDFQVSRVLREKSLITVRPSSEEDLHQDLQEDAHVLMEVFQEDASLLSVDKLPALLLSVEYRHDAPGCLDNPENKERQGSALFPVEEAPGVGPFPQKEEAAGRECEYVAHGV
ncbi:interleukin-6 receptor subunit beta isoform 2-T2 [Spinachia spinachia]